MVATCGEDFVERPSVVSCNLEVTFELLLVGRHLDVGLVRLLDEDDLVAVAAYHIGSFLVGTILKQD